MDIRFTKVKVDQQGLSSRHGVERREVGREESLTITGLGRGNTNNHLVFAAQHEFHTRTDGSKHLRITGSGRGAYERRVLALRVPQGTDETEVFEFDHILRRTDLVIEQLTEDDQNHRNKEADNQIGRSRFLLCLRIHDSRRTGFIHDAVIRRIGSLLNLGLGTFLQEEGIVVIIDAVVTLDSHHFQFFLRQLLNRVLHFLVTVRKVGFLDLQRSAHRSHHFFDSGLDILDILGIFRVVHVLLRQLAALDAQVVELLYKAHQDRLVHAHGRRSDHGAFLDIIVDILDQVVEIGLAQAELHRLLVISGHLSHKLTGIRGDVHELVLLTEIGHSAFAHLQGRLQVLQLLVDEADGVLGYFVLLLEVLQQVNLCQLINELAVALRRLADE